MVQVRLVSLVQLVVPCVAAPRHEPPRAPPRRPIAAAAAAAGYH